MMECAYGISGSLNQECRKRLIRQMFRVGPKRDCIFAVLSTKAQIIILEYLSTYRVGSHRIVDDSSE
jgi:hypothetical protein